MASSPEPQNPPQYRQRPPTSDPSTTATSIELPELSPPPDRGRALSSTSSVISNTLGPSVLTHPPPPITSDRPSSATESDRSVTPPSTASLSSTPATSVHPSFSSHDRERPTNYGERTRNDEPERAVTPDHVEENSANGRLSPIPQGALPPEPGSSATQPPPQDPLSSPAATPSTFRAPSSLPSLPSFRHSTSHASPLQTSIALAALIITFIATVYYGHRADKMNLSMMWGAYRQDCWNEKGAGTLSPECEAELGRGMKRPPYTYRVKRGLGAVGGWVKGLGVKTRGIGGGAIAQNPSSESRFSAYLKVLLIPLLVATVLIFFIIHRRRVSFQRRPQQGPDLVRNVPPFMILREPKTGQDIGLTRRRTKNSTTESMVLSNRKKSLQDHFDDLHNNPEWKQHLEVIVTDDEDEHHGELPGERISRITRTLQSESDFNSDTETGSDTDGDSASVMSKFKRNIREKLRRGDTGDSTLSALGTLERATRTPEAQSKGVNDPNPDSKSNSHPNHKSNTSNPDADPDAHTLPGYNFRIKKGITSMGLVSIGTTLGASAGGEIGQEMLVKGVDASELGDAKGDLMIPGDPQDVSMVPTVG